MEESNPPYTTRKRQRASIACQSCNSRRVKCNAATVGSPCSNCQCTGRDCQLIKSKRGKRKSKSKILAKEGIREEQGVPRASDGPANGDPLGRRIQQVPDSDDNTNSLDGATNEHYPSIDGERTGYEENPRDGANGPGHEMLYAQTLEVDESPTKRRFMKPGGQVSHLGETFNLTYVLHQTRSENEEPEEKRPLHYQLPTDVVDLDAGAKHREKDLLQLQNAFDTPKSNVCLELFKAYFEKVAPQYPIIDRSLFLFQYAIPQRPQSWLLLQAVLFMAAGHCDEDILKEAGFESRYDARLTLFKRTKALYDAEYEEDKVTIVQAVFLMSFWWATPIDSKDTWHWLGIAISLALTIGMHRSTKDPNMSLKNQRLWKRIWGSLFTEDKHAAAALGRPARIRLSDCDVEKLETADFEGELYGFGDTFTMDLPKVVLCYPICLSSLSMIVERIIEKPSLTSASHNNSFELCEATLQVWEARLSEFLHLDHPESGNTVWPSMLHIAAW